MYTEIGFFLSIIVLFLYFSLMWSRKTVMFFARIIDPKEYNKLKEYDDLDEITSVAKMITEDEDLGFMVLLFFNTVFPIIVCLACFFIWPLFIIAIPLGIYYIRNQE